MRYGLSAEPTPGAKPGTSAKADKADKSDKSSSNDSTSEPAPIGGSVRPQGRGAGHAVRRQPSAVRFEREDEGPSHRDVPRPEREMVTAHVFPRSTFSIFQYLGRLVAAGDEGQIKLITDQAKGDAPLEDDTLFAVTTAAARLGGDCFLTVDDGGANYCVPASALNTKRILGLLVQLLALNTSICDVGITQQVQLLPQ